MCANGYFIQTTDEARAELWENFFGTVRLPVVTNKPREEVTRDGIRNVFDIALKRLTEAQLNHFLGHIQRETGLDYDYIKREYETRLTGSITVSSADCIVLVESTETVSEDETAVSQQRRPFFILSLAYDMLVHHWIIRWCHLRSKRRTSRNLSPC